MTIRLLALLMLAPTIAAADAPGSIELFRAGEGGYASYRIPGIVATRRGTLLAYAEARRGPRGDWGANDLVIRRGEHGGATWGPIRPLVARPEGVRKNPVALAQGIGREGEVTLSNATAIADPSTGVVHVLYCVEYARCYAIRSVDDGLTFSEPVDITPALDAFRPEYDWRVVATGPGHGIRLATGRLIVPVWLSTGAGAHGHRPSAVATIASDDAGATWRRGAIVAQDPDPANPSETAAVELADGRVMLNIRNESSPAFRAVSLGPDGVGGWSPPRLDPNLPDTVCMASLLRLPGSAEASKGRLLYSAPSNPGRRERSNLTLRPSDDEGASWPLARTIDPGLCGYSDLAVGPDGMISCLYERNVAKAISIRLTRFAPGWIGEGP